MSTATPELVSTVIPAYNRAELLAEAVGSVLAQTYRPIEIIVSDDGSTDATPDVARALERKHPGVVRYARQANRGPGPAREAGRLLARGEFIQYLDSDDRLLPGKFASQVAALHAHPECDIAYGRTRLIDAAGTVLCDPFKWTGRALPQLFPGLLVDRWWCTHTPLYRRTLCDAIGPWANLRFSQDWEYDARAGARRARLAWCDTLVSEHRHHAGARQTGGGRWLAPADQVTFFTTLARCAGDAGVPREAPEMQHFARWVFARARQCGAAGDRRAAQQLFDLARSCMTSADATVRMASALSRTIGWRLTGRLCAWRDRLAGGRAGSRTQKQSWMR